MQVRNDNGGLNMVTDDLVKKAEELARLIDKGQMRTVFQPIVSLRSAEILGYEALSRAESTILGNPEELFATARACGLLWELEYLCRLKALENYAAQKQGQLLFINVDPRVVGDEKFRKGFTLEFLHEYGLSPSDTVLEITEQNSGADENLFRRAINHYQEQSYNIAIDDTGSGYSGLNLITKIQPKYIKLDMNLIRGIHTSKLKNSLVGALASFGRDCGIRLVAEGIETKEELSTVIELGVDYGQGYFLARPAGELPTLSETAERVIRAAGNSRSIQNPFRFAAGTIAEQDPALDFASSGEQADTLFRRYPEIYGIPVTEEGRVQGLISRSFFYYQLGTQFGRDLFIRRPVSLVMDKSPLVVDYYMDIDTVCARAMSRSVDKLYNAIVVTKNERYYGTLSVKSLLEKVSELKIENAKHLNPLTYLPGNVIIENRLVQLLETGAAETILYLDIDNFKAYNDRYGTMKGDRFLTFVADCVMQACGTFAERENIFIGHVGGDDFILIAPDGIAYALGAEIIRIFEEKKGNLYCEEALKNGGITAKSRAGILMHFPLATLSIAGVKCSGSSCRSIYKLTESAAVVKKACKQVSDNCIIIREADMVNEYGGEAMCV